MAKTKDNTSIEWTSADIARFWSHVDKSDDCWVWTGSTSGWGYGRFWVNGRAVPAHLFSFLLSGRTGGPIIRHTCDNPPCVNPAHLISGTQHENMMDAKERGRFPSSSQKCEPRHVVKRTDRERNGRAILDREKVAEIRERYGATKRCSLRSLAREFGISKSQVHNIVEGRQWNFL